ncbi:hypothetical protein EJ03DRAFT_11791 [Teratosphaeria nubilosa]|uniref:Uncharacterized protein n=1 Tax=Teratosphaeria nubilosa TaxID=161662 RepID=A0A6G1LHA0_9PEZI|nr:hypothetical protein EJ03DRAFT_11791 [Teratosphaeria nubilosa]
MRLLPSASPSTPMWKPKGLSLNMLRAASNGSTPAATPNARSDLTCATCECGGCTSKALIPACRRQRRCCSFVYRRASDVLQYWHGTFGWLCCCSTCRSAHLADRVFLYTARKCKRQRRCVCICVEAVTCWRIVVSHRLRRCIGGTGHLPVCCGRAPR